MTLSLQVELKYLVENFITDTIKHSTWETDAANTQGNHSNVFKVFHLN